MPPRSVDLTEMGEAAGKLESTLKMKRDSELKPIRNA
jgi:hypothetical protein